MLTSDSIALLLPVLETGEDYHTNVFEDNKLIIDEDDT